MSRDPHASIFARAPRLDRLPALLLWLALAASAPAIHAQGTPPPPGRPDASGTPSAPTAPPRSPLFPSIQSSPIGDTARARSLREAQLLIRGGKFAEALSRLATVPPLDPSRTDVEVLVLRGACLRQLGRFDEARDLYRKEADAMVSRGEDPTPILMELERVHRERREPEKAFDVCLEIHRKGKAAGVWVVDEMESLIQADSLGERALPPLRAEIDRAPDASDLRDLLVTALLFLGKTGDALQAARDLDRARGAHGAVLLEHLRLLDRKGLGQPAVDAADATLAAGPKPDQAQEALVLRAAALRRLHRLPEASEAYERAASTLPDGPLARMALRDRADLVTRDMGDLAAGAKAYEALIDQLRRSPGRDQGVLLGQAQVALADCRIRLGRYEEAATVLAQVEAQAPDQQTKEEAAFQQAELLFYSGKADTARAAYDRVVKQYAGGTRVNDALDRILTLTRCADAGAVPLAALGQIAYERRIGAAPRALEICQEAEKACGSCDADEDLLREEGFPLLDMGKLEEAAASADTLAHRHADGSSAPKLLRAVADRLRARDGDSEAVIHRYEDLLTRFPKSHEAYEVRPILEKMRRTGSLDGGRPEARRG